jgi:ribulose-phosphate 3-epimerase
MSLTETLASVRKDAPALSVSILAADLLALRSEIQLLEQARARLIHIDVMDGHFCPQLTVGPAFVRAIRTSALKDVHLMIEEPLDQLEGFVAAGADIISVHVESTRHIHRVLRELGAATNANDPDRDIIRGLALNPGTPVDIIQPLLADIDLVLLLAVDPGWPGQTLDATTPARLQAVRELVPAAADILVGVDGGVTRANIDRVAALRPDIIVTGSAIFDGRSARENLEHMMARVGRHCS